MKHPKQDNVGKVSIGIPTYNRPEELRRTLAGIAHQTYQNLEIIVSDNASPSEQVTEVVREFMRGDERIQYVRQPQNIGVYANFQFVLDGSSGEFFMWAADDDFREPTFIENLVGQLAACPECAIAFSDFVEVDENGEKLAGYPRHLPLLKQFTSGNRFLALARFFFQLESKGKANVIYGLMRRKALQGFHWESFVRKYGTYGADMLFVFSVLAQGRLAISEQCLYRCTVGNRKDYGGPAAISWKAKVIAPFAGLAKQLIYSVQYVRIAAGWARLAILLCWPIKALDITIRIFLFTELRNLVNRVRRIAHR